MKKWIVISCVLVLGIGVLIFFLVSNQQKSQEDNGIMKIAIFPTGTSEESYYFILNQEGKLKCSMGSRKDDNINQRNFIKTVAAFSEKILSELDLQALINMADKLETKGYSEKQFWTDSWNVAFLYNGKVYEMDYWHNENSEEFMNLINKIIELSPIPVDLHGWA